VAIARGHLQNQLNTLIDQPGPSRVARRFAAHLVIEFPAVLTFLLEPDVIEATDWRAEHALRPAVVTRKVCGGNRSQRGAQTHAVLASVLRTIQQRQLNGDDVFSDLFRSPRPIIALAPPTASQYDKISSNSVQTKCLAADLEGKICAVP
jgi:transposase